MRSIRLMLGILLAAICSTSWAMENKLQYTLVGVQGQAFANALATLKNQEGLLTYPLTPDEIRRFYESAPGGLEKSLQPYGYFRPVITSTIEVRKHIWMTHFIVNPGPQMLVSDIDVEISGPGKNNPEFIKLLQNFPLRKNGPLNIDDYNKAKDELFKVASAKGYFTAKIVESRIIIDLKQYSAKIILQFETGKRFRFGETTFHSSIYSDNFLRRFLTYHSGEYYDYAKVQKSQQYFVTSNYFAQTQITPNLDQMQDDQVPIDIKLIPQKAQQITYGVGYGSDTGARATFGLNLRHMRFEGHHMNILAQLSTSGNHVVSANYYIPGKNPALDQYIISGGIGHLEIQNPAGWVVSTNEKLSLAYATQLGEIQQTIALTYLNEYYILPQFNLPYINSQTIYPSVMWQFMHRDRTFQPTEGISALGIISAAPGYFDLKFFQARLKLRELWTPFHNTRLLLREDLGHTSINNLTRLPLSLQLLAGGVNSIRGFNFDSIGPGYNMLVGSAEIQQRIYGNLYLGFFIDSGTVFQGQVYTGVGPSLAYVSPVGTLEISVARSTNPHQTGYHFDFSMGQDL